MSIVIHKQVLSLEEHQTFTPGGEVRKLLDIQVQRDNACLWYEINTDAGPSFQTEVHITVVGTGFYVPSSPFAYIATTQVGQFVWHWYGKRVFLP